MFLKVKSSEIEISMAKKIGKKMMVMYGCFKNHINIKRTTNTILIIT